MSGINEFIIDGNVTKDVELRYTPRGTPVATYAVAVDDVTGVGDDRRETTNYIPVTTYGRQAENDARYLKKGSGVTVFGKISSWYKPEQKKGGFNFEAKRVIYRSKSSSASPSASPNASPSAEPEPPSSLQNTGSMSADEWLDDYNQAEQTIARPRRS